MKKIEIINLITALFKNYSTNKQEPKEDLHAGDSPLYDDKKCDFHMELLGKYDSKLKKVFIYDKTIKKCLPELQQKNGCSGLDEDILTIIVRVHEYAHWFYDASKSNSAKSPINLFKNTDTFVHEQMAQIITYVSLKDKELKKHFVNLSRFQPYKYRINDYIDNNSFDHFLEGFDWLKTGAVTPLPDIWKRFMKLENLPQK